MFDLALLNGTVVTSSGRNRADNGLQDGIITAISADLSATLAQESIDLGEHFILPACIYARQHLWEPGMLARVPWKGDCPCPELAS
jgi:dihydroorotase-like cyclic amidohydrolase